MEAGRQLSNGKRKDKLVAVIPCRELGAMSGEITLKSTLQEALEIIREELRLSSAKYNCLEPARGMEESWAQALVKVRILEAHIHALDSEEVRKALYKWKKGAQEYGADKEDTGIDDSFSTLDRYDQTGHDL